MPRLFALAVCLFVCVCPAALKGDEFNYNLIENYLHAGRFLEARSALTARLERAPNDGYAHLLLGIVCGELRDADASEKQFREASQLRPRDPAPHTNLGNLLASQGRLVDATKQFEAALVLNPRDVTSLSNLGSVRMSLKQYGAAMKCFETASRVAPGDLPILLGLFQAQLKSGLTEPARQTATRLLLLPGVDAEAFQIVGALQAESGDYATAVKSFEKGVRLFPDSAALEFNLGLALRKSGNAARAAAVLEALRTKHDTAELQDVLGEVHEQNGEFLAAVQSYQRAAEMEPKTESYRFDYAAELLAHLNFEAALLVAGRAAHDFPDSVRINVALGVALFGLTRFQEAQEVFLNAARRFPDSDLPLVYIDMGEEANDTTVPGSRELLKTFYQRHETQFMAPYLLGRAAFRDGDPALAATLFAASVKLRADYAPSHFELGRAFAELGRMKDAVDQYRAALRTDPGKVQAWYRLTLAYRKLGQASLADAAEAQFRKLGAAAGKPETVQKFVYKINRD